ncbi:MAG: hypothetical protein ABIR32_04850 [Ilumatobacteraceae bacterium]
MRSRFVVVLILVAALVVVRTGHEQPSPAEAAPVSALLAGDSVMNGLAQSYGANARSMLAARHSFLLETAGCRRLITTSCSIGSSPQPSNALSVVRARAGQYAHTLVVAAGYNDPSTGSVGVATAVDVLIAEAMPGRPGRSNNPPVVTPAARPASNNRSVGDPLDGSHRQR